MGLREKVALLIFIEIVVQIMYGQCVQHSNKWISSFQVPHKKYKIRKHAKPIQRPITREGCVARLFNFPEVEYSLPPTPTSPFHSNQKFDLHSEQVPKLNSSPLKYSVSSTNEPGSRKYKKNRKNSDSGTNAKKFTALPETASVPNTCFNNQLFFPSVDYPLDVTDLWTPHYWNRFPQIQPETKLDIVDLSINTKPKKDKAKIAKGSRKYSKVNDILNSRIETKTMSKTETLPIINQKDNVKLNIKKETAKSKQNATNCENHSNNSSTLVKILPKERFTPISINDELKQCTADSVYNRNNYVNSQEIINSPTVCDVITPYTTTDESLYTVYDINGQAPIGEVTSAPNAEKHPYCTESVTSTTANIISFLTTLTPPSIDSNENFLDNSVLPNPQTPLSSEINLCNSTEIENDEDPLLPDDMGYTIMYPEPFSSLSTSTMPPLDDNKIDSAWMYPEFDNHTFNTYSDEVEQCYILVP